MRFHICVSVRGMLAMSDAEWRRIISIFTKDDGTQPTISEAKNYLMDELAQGHEKLPGNPDCDNFDYKTGCLGHPDTNEKELTNGY